MRAKDGGQGAFSYANFIDISERHKFMTDTDK